MKTLLLTGLMLTSTTLWAEEDLSVTAEQQLPPVEVVEQQLPPAEITEKNFELTIKIGRVTYVIPGPSKLELDSYSKMSEFDQKRFRDNRSLILIGAARAFTMIKPGIGAGAIAKDRVRYAFRKFLWDPMHKVNRQAEEKIWRYYYGFDEKFAKELAHNFHGDDPDIDKDEELNSRFAMTLPQLSQSAIQEMLKSFDYKLWSQAELCSRANEFGMMATAGPETINGVQNGKGWGGSFDLGFTIGVNRDTRAVAFQFFVNPEKYKNTIAFVGLTGLYWKVGPYFANQQPGALERKGTSFYPPMTPGYSMIAPDFFSAGFSSGITWPPSPIGDMFTYTNAFHQRVVLRLTISPVVLGFVRVETGLGRRMANYVLTSVQTAIEKIKSMGRAKTCATEVVGELVPVQIPVSQDGATPAN